jgi:hypothetical protein
VSPDIHRRVVVQLMVDSTTLWQAGRIIHDHSHFSSFEDCAWATCMDIRKNREAIQSLVEELQSEALAT